MDHNSDGEVDSEEEARQMRKAAVEEKRIEAEYKDAAKVKAEEIDRQQGQATVTKGKSSKHSEYGQLFERMGNYSYFKSLLFFGHSEKVLHYVRSIAYSHVALTICLHKRTFLRINICKHYQARPYLKKTQIYL